MAMPSRQSGIETSGQALAAPVAKVGYNLNSSQFPTAVPPVASSSSQQPIAAVGPAASHYMLPAQHPVTPQSNRVNGVPGSNYPLSPLAAFLDESSQAHPADSLNSPQQPFNLDPSYILPPAGIWFDDTHEGCEICVQHRHDPDGGVYFASVPTLTTAVGRMRVFVSVEEVEGVLSRVQTQLTAVAELQGRMLAELEARQGTGKLPAAPDDDGESGSAGPPLC